MATRIKELTKERNQLQSEVWRLGAGMRELFEPGNAEQVQLQIEQLSLVREVG